MRIVLAGDTYPPDINGAAQFTYRLARGLAGRGHQVHVLAPSSTGRSRTSTDELGVVLHGVTSVRYGRVLDFHFCLPWVANREVGQVLREVQPDVAHTQAHFVVGRALAVNAHRLGIPLVATNHFMPENLIDPIPLPNAVCAKLTGLAWRDFGNVYQRADKLTAPTPRAVDLMARRAHLPGAEPISCGIDAEPYHRAAERAGAHEVPVVMFAGRLELEKHVEDIIQAVALLPADLPLRVEIVGDGMQRRPLEELSQRLGVADRVVFRGFIDADELVDTYGRADVFCMPGVAELQSLVTLESMAASTPVIAANAVALPHLVHHGENGFLYTPGDAAELAQHLEVLLRDPALRARMGEQSARIADEHALGRTLNRFEQIYAEVTGRRS